MKPRHQVSRAAIDLIKRFEGFREKAAQLPDGRWTLGYGHTQTAREGAYVSERDAEALLMYDLIGVAHAVNEQVFTPLTQNQFDALAAFVFNIGLPAFRNGAVLRLINEGQLLQAACAMELWRKADFEGQRIVVDALVRRRAAEKALFLTPPDGFVPAPTPLLTPRVDADGLGLVPRDTPAIITACLDGEMALLSREAPPAQVDEPGPEIAPEAAAAALAERLARIFPDEPPMEPEAAFPAEAAPTLPEAEAPETTEAPAEAAEIVQPSAEAEGAPEPNGDGYKAFVLCPPAAAETLPPPETEPGTPIHPQTAEPQKSTPAWRGKVAGLAALVLLGALLLAGGLYWMFYGQTAAAGAPSQTLLGWIIGVAGVFLLGGAAYVLLDLLGRGDEELDALED